MFATQGKAILKTPLDAINCFQKRGAVVKSRNQLQVVMVASPVTDMKVYKAGEMSEADLQRATARPRVDFTSILDVVSSEATRVALH